MEFSVLIAEPLDILRAGLRSIFLEDPRVSNVYEAANTESLRTILQSNELDLAVINQALVPEIVAPLAKNFVILAAEPDIVLLKAAYKHGASGYLSVNVSAELLRAMLRPTTNTFLIAPTLTPLIMERIFGPVTPLIKEELLTPREKEIVGLLRQGVDRPSIAKQLCITESTLKTHMKNITRKRETEPFSRNGTY